MDFPPTIYVGGSRGSVILCSIPTPGEGSGAAPLNDLFFEKCLVKYYNFIVNLACSLCHRSDSRSYVNLRFFCARRKPTIIYKGIVLWLCIIYERGDYEKVKRKLQ